MSWGTDSHLADELTVAHGAVQLVVPASSPYLRTVRMVAADAADRAGMTCHEVEDFRIALDELCHVLITATDHELELVVLSREGSVVARGRARRRARAALPVPSSLTRSILASVADRYDLYDEDDSVCFLAVKHAQPATPGFS